MECHSGSQAWSEGAGLSHVHVHGWVCVPDYAISSSAAVPAEG
jgi:hypothetical protein